MKRSTTAAVARQLSPDELEFMDHVKLALGRRNELRLWRQNCGVIPIRNRAGKVERYFHAGPPNGAADLSGIVLAPVRTRGLRLEIELKSSTGSRSPAQIRWADFIERAGGVYALIAYNASLSMTANVDLAVATVLAAIERRAAT